VVKVTRANAKKLIPRGAPADVMQELSRIIEPLAKEVHIFFHFLNLGFFRDAGTAHGLV
jgi:hypothetical protein